MTKFLMLFAVACFWSALAAAQQGGIGTVTASPSPAKVGQPITITISAEGEAPKYCGLRVEYGDSSEDFKIDESNKQFPVVVSHTYAVPGSYTIKARGKMVTNHGRCPGQAEVAVVVEGAAPAPAAATAAAASPCPTGYTLKGKVGKAGDFVCRAGKGATAPDRILACRNGLEYFQAKATLGCRKAKK